MFASELCQIWPKWNILCDSDKRNGNELFVYSEYGSQRPLLATAVLKLYYNHQFLLDSRRQNTTTHNEIITEILNLNSASIKDIFATKAEIILKK